MLHRWKVHDVGRSARFCGPGLGLRESRRDCRDGSPDCEVTMDRKQAASVWSAGAVSALAVAVLVGLAVGPPARQEGAEGRAAREAAVELAHRTVVYDPKNYIGFDPQAFYVPPNVTEGRVEERHALAECAMEYAPSASDATDATLFAEPGQRIGLGPVFGDRGYHAHVIAGGKDKIYRPDDRGDLTVGADAAPSKIVLVTTS